jgi:hypothetical protein
MRHLSWQEFISLIQKSSSFSWSRKHDQEIEKTALFPDLTWFRCIASCHFSATKITPFRENYLQSARKNARSRWILKCPNCNKTSYQQVVHIVPLLRCKHVITARLGNNHWAPKKSIPNQHILWLDSIIDSVQNKPANPLIQRHTQIRNDISTFAVNPFAPTWTVFKSHVTLAVVKYFICNAMKHVTLLTNSFR